MTSASGTNLQQPIDAFARALTVPRRLLALHPRKRGHPGAAAALAPAITLSVISAFEGFVEEFVATAAVHLGHGYAQIAKMVGALNNPDVARFERLLTGQTNIPSSSVGRKFEVDIWEPPKPGTTWWLEGARTWEAAKIDARAWMEARHLLTHGITSGWQAENWPGTLSKENPPPPPASSVLRETPTGRHSLAIHGAISCARIYVETSRHLAQLTAQHLGVRVNVNKLPDFPLYSEAAPINAPVTQIPSQPEERREPAEEDDEVEE